MRNLQKVIVVGATTLSLVGVGAGAAWASTPTLTPSSAQQAGFLQPHQQQASVPVTISGTVVRVETRTIEIREKNGRVSIVQVSAKTSVTKNGRAVRVAEVKPGNQVTVTAQRSGGVIVATAIKASGR